MAEIRLLESDSDLGCCYPVMAQLRPHLDENGFLAQVRRQGADGYRIAALFEAGAVRALAGFRIGENLAWGRHLYVDDLVTDEQARGRGLGGVLFDWLVDYAKSHGCGQLHLDSGVQRFAAHRFYAGKGMMIASHHFALTL